MAQQYAVETENNGDGWSYIIGPNGYREGPIRYRWEAEEWAEEMNNGKPPPAEMRAACEFCGEQVSEPCRSAANSCCARSRVLP